MHCDDFDLLLLADTFARLAQQNVIDKVAAFRLSRSSACSELNWINFDTSTTTSMSPRP